MKPLYNWWKWHCSDLQIHSSSDPMPPSLFWYIVAEKLYIFIQRTFLKSWNRLLSDSKFYQFFSVNINTTFLGKFVPLCSFHPHKLPLLLSYEVWPLSRKQFSKLHFRKEKQRNGVHACTCTYSNAKSMSNRHSPFLSLLGWSCRILGSNTSQTAVNDHCWRVPQKRASRKLDLYSYEFLVRSEEDSSLTSQKLTAITYHILIN